MNGAGIQVEEGGFARIHNDILSALAVARFTGSEYRCLLFLFRMTYGWQKKEDTISISQWAAGIGIEFGKRHNAWRILQGLIEKRVIYANDNGPNRPMTWGFNKYIEQWDKSLFPPTVIPQDNSSVMPQDNSCESVMPQDNRTVIPPDNRTVIPQDNNKRKGKIRKEKAAAAPVDPVMDAWLNNMPGTMTPILADSINDLRNEYGDVAFVEAIKIAVKRNRRSLDYVVGCLQRGVDVPAPTNGKPPPPKKRLVIENPYTGEHKEVES